MNAWLKDAIFYQIYPVSYFDGNGDGIGDLKGIIKKLDYIKKLGVNAIWINPIFKSPFMDGGYDIQDYYQIDERFGSMEDFEALMAKCNEYEIKVFLDLVVGHTSTMHAWFQECAKDEINDKTDYYIWTDSNYNLYKDRTICGLFPRDGAYYINYYACQPALNFGFNNVIGVDGYNATPHGLGEDWKMHYTDERLSIVREEVYKIVRFWKEKGVYGFRVDLAGSLVKECIPHSDKDEDIAGLVWLWNKMLAKMREEFPEICFIAEWAQPENAVGKCGFDMDFFAHELPCYNQLFRYEPNTNLLSKFEKDYSYFGPDGKGSVEELIEYTFTLMKKLNGKGYFSIPSGSHDQIRLGTNKDQELLKTVFAMLLTYKHAPLIYYGDEIGMKHNFQVNKDGGFNRTGARTPFQWTNGKNRGFSDSDTLYLPVNDDEEQSVETQEQSQTSLLNTVRALISIRKNHSCLNAEGDFEVVSSENKGYPFVYRRQNENESIVVALNPGLDTHEIAYQGKEILLMQNCVLQKNSIQLQAKSFVVYVESN